MATKQSPTFALKFSWPLVAVCVLFVISRLWVLYAPIRQSTVGLFTMTGYEYRYAAAHGESVYAVHERKIRAELDSANPGGPPPDPSRLRLEYPPLAIWAMTLPTYFAPPVGAEWELTDEHFRDSKAAFRWMMAGIDCATFAAMLVLLRRLYPGKPGAQTWRLSLYLIAGLTLYHVLYDRFDLLMGSLVLIALTLLLGKSHWSLALAALAVAIHLKLVPVLLAPVFVVGAMPVRSVRLLRQQLTDLTIRSLVLIGWLVLIALPFALSQGSSTFAFLGYHAERGVQVESIPATLLLVLGKVTGLELSHGAIDVVSPWGHGAARIATGLSVLVALLIALLTLFWGLRKPAAAPRTLAAACPFATINLIVLMLFATMSTAKVFSPQYLLWILPLVPLVPARHYFHVLFLVLCGLTTYIFPYRYWTDIARITDAGILPPTSLGVTLLILRNGLFVVLLVLLAIRTARSIEPHPPAG